MAKRKTAMASEPKSKPPTGGGYKAKPNVPLQRLSPGVYRGAGGGLVTQRGRPLPGQGRGIAAALQSNKGPAPSPDRRATIEAAAGRGFNQGAGTTMQLPTPQPISQPMPQPMPQPTPGDQINYAPDGMTGTQMPGHFGYGNQMYVDNSGRNFQDYMGSFQDYMGAAMGQPQLVAEQPNMGQQLSGYQKQVMPYNYNQQPMPVPSDPTMRQAQMMPQRNYTNEQMQQRMQEALQARQAMYRGG